MQKLLTSLAVLGSGLLLALACTEEKPSNLFPNPDAGLSGLPRAGSGGSAQGGSAGLGGSNSGPGGSSGAGGSAGDGLGGSAGQSPDAGPVTPDCSVDADCDDHNACTLESCQSGSCVTTGFTSVGMPCGDARDDQCTDPDTCDGAGVCQRNDNAAAVGMACGSATDDQCANPDTCDANGVCQPNDEIAGTPCGSSTDDECSHADVCDEFGLCSPNNVATGTPCGSGASNECTGADVCGNGVCVPNDLANGSACSGGSCAAGACVNGQPVGCPVDVVNSVPTTLSWSSVGHPDLYGGGCDSSENTPEYALVFTAPQAGVFRFRAAALVDNTPYTGDGAPDGDAVMTVAAGSCAGPAAVEVDCNDDLTGESRDSQLDLVLGDQEKITVYLNELTQTGGGTGTLSITLLP